MKTYTKPQLNCILEKHEKWLRSEGGGERANLSSANLRFADLRFANLSSANLRFADLRFADLRFANLRFADLRFANLSSANLSSADLRFAKNLSALQSAALSIVPDAGAFEGWKKCRDGVLVRLLIPASAKRSNATGRKCRAEFVEVLDVVGGKEGVSAYSDSVKYIKGKTVKPDGWCEDRWSECAPGIHFFITRAEAEAYQP